jgi:predicted aconitase/predicted aconitase with swiveling domain
MKLALDEDTCNSGNTEQLKGQVTYHGIAYVQGKASGPLIASNLELSFWGGVDPQTSEVIDRHHPLSGKHIQDAILAIPSGRGSCSGSGVLLELILNDKGPKGLIFSRKEDILTLGVVVAEEIFNKSVPVVVLGTDEFQDLQNATYATINGNTVSRAELKSESDTPELAEKPLGTSLSRHVELSDEDEEFLEGLHGRAPQAAMRIILRMAAIAGAEKLIDITQVHIDGCIYTGPGSLSFAERLRDWGGKVLIPTTLNSISVDQKRWRSQGVTSTFGEAAEKLAAAYTDMGARPTFTCAPYLLSSAPKKGDQVAWAESNAVVYANSVLGARTMKYPDFLDICIALTGRAPHGGLHLKQNRLASIRVEIPNLQREDIDDSLYPLLGYYVGGLSGSRIPVLTGFEGMRPSTDDLKAFGAAFATMASAPMFHIVGVTPEAATLRDAIGETDDIESISLDLRQLEATWRTLNSAQDGSPVDLISLGNPHFSITEMRMLANICRGRTKDDRVSVMVTCGRAIHGLASQAGLIEELERFGVQFITDTCWCMINEPVIPTSAKTILTNSAKYAHYGPGLTGKKFYFGSLERCVAAACTGSYDKELPKFVR